MPDQHFTSRLSIQIPR